MQASAKYAFFLASMILSLTSACVTSDPLKQSTDDDHISYMRKLDKPCRKVVSDQLKKGSFKTGHYLLSKPLGRLYQSYIVLVSESGKHARLIVCENELPKDLALDHASGKKLAAFKNDMKKLNKTLISSDIDFSPGSLAQGMYVKLERSPSGIKTKEYWLGMDMVKEVAPDFDSVFR